MQVVCVLLGVVVVGTWAMVLPKISEPPCDSLEAETAAAVFQDYINAQRTSGFKYALNQIDKIKISTLMPDREIYKMELDLLETKCHVRDPTPVAACPVRTKAEVAVEAECDVAFIKSGGALKVTAHRCKSEPETSAEDMCLGCPQLLPLNDTNALQMATASLAVFNNRTANVSISKYAVLEVGRFTTQVVAGGPQVFAEYAIVETNCTTTDDDNCVPLNTTATYGFCKAGGANVAVDCRIFRPQLAVEPAANGTMPAVNNTVPAINNTIPVGGFDPLLMVDMMGQLSAESAEFMDPIKMASIIPIVKRQAPNAETVAPSGLPITMTHVRICPGKKKHF